MADNDARPFLTAAGDGQTLRNPLGGPLTFKARTTQTGGALTAFESLAAPGEGPPLHRHEGQDELLYVLEGGLRFLLDGELQDAPAGSFVFVPRGAPHTWQNAADEPARFLVVFTPAAPGMERFFERAAELPDATRAREAFRSFAAEGGMDVLGAPLAADR
jgi:quercetin dioxygenase-like cupin family protein